MAIIDGFPATSFDARDRKWVKDVVETAGGLPDPTGANQGDVLTIGSGGPEWDTPSSGLPDTTGASQGDVLTIGNDGPEWDAPSGGSPIFTIHIDWEADENYAETEETLNEIVAAINDGKIITVAGYSPSDITVQAAAPVDGTGGLSILTRNYTPIDALTGIYCGIEYVTSDTVLPAHYDDPVQLPWNNAISGSATFGPPSN